MRVLVGCEFSGVVRDAFAKRGHDAWSCDLLPSETKGHHLQGDVLNFLDMGWDLAIFHPPCTRLCNSGVRWLNERNLWKEMEEGAAFFSRLYYVQGIKRVAVENPVMHRYAIHQIGVRPTQYVQPWQFGDGETKKTGLWLRNLPPLKPTNIVEGRTPRVHHMSPGEDRAKERSRFFPGIAAAMADQWGDLNDA